jgi:16S rRNA U516 pseudouridylate synthase RsuA-like enzyme
VRRMLAHLGYRVVWLCRVNFGPLSLVEPGQARPLTPREVEALRSG